MSRAQRDRITSYNTKNAVATTMKFNSTTNKGGVPSQINRTRVSAVNPISNSNNRNDIRSILDGSSQLHASMNNFNSSIRGSND